MARSSDSSKHPDTRQLDTSESQKHDLTSIDPYSLLGVGAALATHDSEEDVARFVGSALTSVLRVKFGAVALINGDGDTFRLFGQFSDAPLQDFLAKEIEQVFFTSTKKSDAFSGETIRDIRVERGRFPKLYAIGLRRLLLARLRTLDRHFGLVLAGKTTDEPYLPIQTASLETLAGQTSMALHRIQLNKEHKRAEQALRESEERFRSLYNYTPVMMHSIDLTGKLVSVNDYWLKVLGYELDEVIGRKSVDFLTEASRRYAVEVTLPEFMKTGFARDVEYQMVRKNGEVIDVLLSATAEKDEAGEIIDTLAFIIDVTERKRAEKALRESEERYRDLYDNAPLAYFSVGQDGRIRMANTHATELLGYVRGDLDGRLVFDLYADTPDGKSKAKRIYQRFMKGEEPEGEELQMRKADGSLVWISLTVRAIRDEQGEILESRSMAVDITERRQAEAELQKYAEELTHSNADLESFSYSVSHDLRAPLRAIDGFSRILLEDYFDKLDAECRRLLNVIRSNTQNMGQLIDDLLVFSQLSRKEMQSTDIDMQALAQAVFQEIKSTAAERKVQLRINKLPPARGDRSMIRQVFVNLISNAIKFTKAKKTAVIEVGSKVEGNSSVYFVKDNGVGFEMQYVDKIFGVFQRLHTVEEFEGTGVGLALVQRIIRRHGGHVSAEGKVNKGATIYFTLPKKGG